MTNLPTFNYDITRKRYLYQMHTHKRCYTASADLIVRQFQTQTHSSSPPTASFASLVVPPVGYFALFSIIAFSIIISVTVIFFIVETVTVSVTIRVIGTLSEALKHIITYVNITKMISH